MRSNCAAWDIDRERRQQAVRCDFIKTHDKLGYTRQAFHLTFGANS